MEVATETNEAGPREELNAPQAAAASHSSGALLIFAGAGSGKTRVITYRIANLVAVHRVPPYRILAVTFTNKAASEMKRRLEGLIGPELVKDLWVGTFHAACARLLRRHHEAAGLQRNFVIYDDADQKAVMARVLKELELDDRRYPPRQVLGRIHKEKQEGRGPDEFVAEGYIDDTVQRCFAAYQRHLQAANAVDFEDLILSVVRIAEDVAPAGAPRTPPSPVGEELRRKFRYVLVDEFQDVNMVQYRLVRALAGETKNLCVVGDDDQSIYRWRGADVRIMRNFRRDFPGAAVVKLEQNYRSSGHIVKGALGIIRSARDREPKELWTARKDGEPIVVAATENEHEEASYVVDRIRERTAQGVSPRDIAVFYRVHAQSRVLEEGMRASRIPYQIIGGTRFFERAEIKDVLAYLRVIDNPRSDVDLARIINVPTRKIGGATVERLLATANASGKALYDAIVPAVEGGSLGTAAKTNLLRFKDLLDGLMREARAASPQVLCEEVLSRTGYREALEQDDDAESDARLQNIQELVGSIADYEEDAVAAGEEGTLAGYLERVTLVSDADTIEDAPKVAMMTVHAAKGLEFDTVLLTGMEEEMFPFRGLDPKHADEMEEERRLAYVAVTRARERLFITHASRRMIFGTTRYGRPSRFVGDLPPAAVRHVGTGAPGAVGRFIDRTSPMLGGLRGPWVHPQDERPPDSWELGGGPRSARLRPPGERYVERDDGADTGFGSGRRVRHDKFGAGVIQSIDDGDDPIATVSFSGWGIKRIKARFLKPG